MSYFEAKGDKERVIQYLEKLDAISPLNMERKIEIARLQLETGNDGDAKDTFESAIRLQNRRLKDDMSETSTRIGNIYLEKGNPEAERYFRRAIEVYGEQLGKSHMHLFNNLGIALRKLGKWKEATQEYLKAIEISPQDEVLHYNTALAFNDGADTVQALQFASSALRINPDIHKHDSTIAFNMALIFSKSGQKAGRPGLLQAGPLPQP